MAHLFCCPDIKPYRDQRLAHELKFITFIQWGQFPRESGSPQEIGNRLEDLQFPFVVQLVQQVNYGAVESKRYFVRTDGAEGQSGFTELTEQDLILANYQKLNSYKNFRCATHNKFFELNVYEKDPFNKHHWRHNIARPGSEIDL